MLYLTNVKELKITRYFDNFLFDSPSCINVNSKDILKAFNDF